MQIGDGNKDERREVKVLDLGPRLGKHQELENLCSRFLNSLSKTDQVQQRIFRRQCSMTGQNKQPTNKQAHEAKKLLISCF